MIIGEFLMYKKVVFMLCFLYQKSNKSLDFANLI